MERKTTLSDRAAPQAHSHAIDSHHNASSFKSGQRALLHNVSLKLCQGCDGMIAPSSVKYLGAIVHKLMS